MKIITNGLAIFCLLITQLANALTLQWDNSPNWPPGTTVEACVNGDCISGIAGNQRAFNASPGAAIDARARAVAADGTASEWAALAQVYPDNPSGLWARKETQEAPSMTIARRGSTARSVQWENTGSASITKETTVAVGDIILIGVSAFSDEGTDVGGTVSISGFTKVSGVIYEAYGGDGATQASLFYRIVDGTEGASFTISTGTGTNRYGSAVLVAFSGSSIEIEANGYTDNASGTSPSAPSLTAAGTNTMLVNFYLYSDPATFTAPSGSDGSFANSPQSTNGSAVSWDAIASSGATGTRTATLGTARDCLGWSVLLKEASGAVTVTSSVSIDALIQKTGITQQSSLDALIQKSFSGTVSLDGLVSLLRSGVISLDAIIKADKNATVSVDGLIQAVKSGVVSIDAAVAVILSATAGIDALLKKALSSTAGIDAIISGGSSASVSLDGLIQSGDLTTASIDGLLQKQFASAASIDAILQGGGSVVSDLDALIQSSKSGVLSLDAIILNAGSGILSVSLDALIRAVRSGSVSIDAIIASAGSGATVGLDALLSVAGVSSISLNALLQAAKSGIVSIDGLIQSAKSAQLSIDGLLSATKTGLVSFDAIVGIVGSAALSLDAILLKTRASGVFLDAVIGFISAIVIPSSRIVLISASDRFVVLEKSDRFVLVKDSDSSILL